MNRDRSTKIIAIVALLVAVVGLSVGFAAFSNSLTISPSANVTPTDNFSVVFSSNGTSQVDGTVTGVGTSGATADEATISDTDNTTISGLKANFTDPGQSVTYTFYAHNIGAYDAYLTNVTFSNVDGEASPKVCTALTGTTASLVNAACDDISIKVSVGGNEYTGSTPNIQNHLLGKGLYETVIVTITYAEGGDVADGDFTVSFGDLTLTYSTANPGA